MAVIRNMTDLSNSLEVTTEIDSYSIVLTSLKGFKFSHVTTIVGDHLTFQCENKKLTSILNEKYFDGECDEKNGVWYEFHLCNYDPERVFVLFKLKGNEISNVRESSREFFFHVIIKALLKLKRETQSRIYNSTYSRYRDLKQTSDITGKCGTIKIYRSDRPNFFEEVDKIMQQSNVLKAMKNLVFFYKCEHSIREKDIPDLLNLISGEANVLEESIDSKICRQLKIYACFQVHYAVNFYCKSNGAVFVNKNSANSMLNKQSKQPITFYEVFGLERLCHFSCPAALKNIQECSYVQFYSNSQNRIRKSRNVSYLAFLLHAGHCIENLDCETTPPSLLDLRIETMRKYACTETFVNLAKRNFDLRMEIVLSSTEAEGPKNLLDKHFPRQLENNFKRIDKYYTL